MTSTTENVKLGVCSVLYDGVNMGFTKGGVEVEVATSTHEVKVDQFGETPIGEIITGRTVQATVPLAETTLENLVRVMPGSVLVTDGIKAEGTITLATAAPVNGDQIVVAGQRFVFKDKPSVTGDVKISNAAGDAALAETALTLAAEISASDTGLLAVADGAVVTLTAKATGAGWNGPITVQAVTPANVTATPLAGGVDATSAHVQVSTAVNTNLLANAKRLVLRPRGTHGEDDFVLFRAACGGALSFAYVTDNERVYSAAFKGYAGADGSLFAVGKVD